MPRPLHLTLRRPVIARIVFLTLCVMGLAMSFGDNAFNTIAAATSDDEARIPLRPNASTIEISLTLAVTRCGSSTHYYEFELHLSETSSGTYTSYRSANDDASPLAFNDVKRGRWYKARGTRCTDTARTDCAAWPALSSAFQVPELPDPPTLGTITVTGDDLSIAYTPTTWSDGSTAYYEFEAHKSTTQSGTYTRHSAANDDVSPAAISDLPGGWYKVRGRRCIDSGRTECGAWSGLSSTAVQVTQSAPPPMSVAIAQSVDNVRVTYRQSTWTLRTSHSYQFELHRSETSSGTYTSYVTSNDVASPLEFVDAPTDYYYKVRGRRCASPGKSCGSWSPFSVPLNVPPKAAYTAPAISTFEVSGDEDDMTVGFRQSSVTGLSSHFYVFELHRADSATGTFRFDKTASAVSTNVTFKDIDRSKVYKARGKRCKTNSGKVCGPWSGLSTTVWDAPSPPSALTLSLANKNMLSATYTRSTTPTASTHYYQLKLIRSDTAAGTFTDYGDVEEATLTASATASESFDSVHTGYYYKVKGRRCASANSDCGEWSSASSSTTMHVMVDTDESPPTISTSKSTEGDDIQVTFPTDSDNGPSGQAVVPDPTPDVSYYVVELRRATTSGGSFQYYASSNAGTSAIPSDVTFTDVEPGWSYKARARACAAAVRKLCGAWTVQIGDYRVSSPTRLPSLTAPTVKPTGNGVLTAEFSLDSSLFTYVLTLESSETGERYTTSATEMPKSTTTTEDFTGLDPTAELLYVVTLKACYKGTSGTCGTAVRAPPIRIPVITLSAASLTDVDLGTASSISVSAKYLPTDKDFKFAASTSSSGTNAGVLKFGKCAGAAAVNSNENSISGRPSTAGPEKFAPIGCSEGTDTLTVDLRSGTTSYHSASRPITVNDDVPTPTNVIANGRTPAGTLSKFLATIRFTPLVGATSYDVGFAIEEDSPSEYETLTVAGSDDFTNVNGTPNQNGDLVLPSRIDEALYKIRIAAVVNGEKSSFSDATVVYTAEFQPVRFDEVADIVLLGYLPTHHYKYTICENTFRSNGLTATQMTAVVADIERGISKWPKAVNWKVEVGDDDVNIIRTTRVAPTSGSCLEASADEMTPWSGKTEVRWESASNFGMACSDHPDAAACVHLPGSDAPRPSEPRAVQPELRSLEGMDAPYMVFRSDRVYRPGVTPTGFTCPELESLATHETGHVFGLAHTNDESPIKSIMEKLPANRKVCAPSIYDVAAILSIYQNEDVPLPMEDDSE